MLRRFPYVLTIVVAICLAILVKLGAWQVQRLTWKTDLLASIEAAKTAPAMPLDQALALPEAEHRRVSLSCPGLNTASWIELKAIVDGRPGVRLISSCATATGSILVDRGFVADDISARPAVAPTTTPFDFTGVLRRGETPNSFTPPHAKNRWFARDIATIAPALKAANPAPYFVLADSSSNPEWEALRPTPLPGDIPNNHLSYAITWFGLAAVLCAIYAAMVLRKLKAK